MNKSLIDRIKKDIEKTGFITELEVGEILRKRQFYTNHNVGYHDKDFNKSREIDITATKSYRNEEANLYIEYHFISEVKKVSKRPWIIFTSVPAYEGYGWRMLH